MIVNLPGPANGAHHPHVHWVFSIVPDVLLLPDTTTRHNDVSLHYLYTIYCNHRFEYIQHPFAFLFYSNIVHLKNIYYPMGDEDTITTADNIGARVLLVKSGGHSHKAGVVPGSLIVSVNDVNCATKTYPPTPCAHNCFFGCR